MSSQEIFLPPQKTLLQRFRPTLKYLGETEVHVYALSIAASVLLSFFPFLIVMVSLCRNVLHWPAAVNAINTAIDDFFPGGYGDFVSRNLQVFVPRHFSVVAILLLLFTANGIFEPLEVALNKAWGVTANRSYLKNQLISLGLIFMCGGLAMMSALFAAMNTQVMSDLLAPPGAPAGVSPEHSTLLAWITLAAFKVAAVPISILILFLVYWILPNRQVKPKHVLPAAIWVGLTLEFLKYINLLTWKLWAMKLEKEYGPFFRSVTVVLWSFLASMVILAGAEYSARKKLENPTVEIPAFDPSRAG